MKVIEIYDRNSNILDHRKNIFKTMDKYMDKFPQEYRKCYDKNLKTLELLKVDRCCDSINIGEYIVTENKIMFKKNRSLGHELIHMATNDMENEQFAFESGLAVEDGLIEGMTEYHHMKAYDIEQPEAYTFEVFCVTMLEDVPNLFESFFIPKENGIFDITSDRKSMYSLLFSLNNYHDMALGLIACDEEDEISFRAEARSAIRHTIDSLISIKLSLESNDKELNTYGDKFIDLINSSLPGKIPLEFYPKYKEYAEKQIKKRIRNR